MIWHYIFGTIYGWIGIAGLIVIGCLAVAYLIPAWRPYAIAVAVVAVSVATAFTKGWLARGRVEQQRKDEAVKRTTDAYDKIEKRPDTPGTVADRLRNNDF